MSPDLKITIGKKVNRSKVKNFVNVVTKFISAERLFDVIKFWLEKVDFKVDLVDLRTNEKTK